MGEAKKVLVVDDERGIRLLLSDVLSGRGFHVSLAKDGLESLEKLETDDFDLVVTDINMPRLDGLEMLKSMEKKGRREKVIIMTADPSDKRLLETKMPRVVSRLFKPFGIEGFLDVVIAATSVDKNMGGGGLRQAAAI